MGEIGESVEKYLSYMVGSIFSKWIRQHPDWDPYIWPGLAAIVVLGLTGAIAYEVKHRPAQAPKPNQPASHATRQSTQAGQPKRHHVLIAWLKKKMKSMAVSAPERLQLPLLASQLFLICAVLGNWPYDYFVLLRVVVFTTCIIALVLIWRGDRNSTWLGVMLPFVVIYNPLFPLHLHRATWTWINLITMPVFALLWFAIREGGYVS
jgi:hypothetical protein